MVVTGPLSTKGITDNSCKARKKLLVLIGKDVLALTVHTKHAFGLLKGKSQEGFDVLVALIVGENLSVAVKVIDA